MIFVGIDIAKDKHDCCILNSDGEVLFKPFTISNNLEGFNSLFTRISSITKDVSQIKVGLEATGHYSYNILGFLLGKELPTYVFNPLHTNLYRKSLSLRKTKTDKVDSHTIALMLASDVTSKAYSYTAYHNEELKSLARYLFSKTSEQTRLRVSISRLITILFPELESFFSTLHITSVYTLLSTFPSAKHISEANLSKLTNLLNTASHGHFKREKAIQLRELARSSIGTFIPSKSLELQQTINYLRVIYKDIEEIKERIKEIMLEMNPPILSIPGIGYQTGAVILAEIGDFDRFSSPDKLLAYTGISPSTYQSGKMSGVYSHVEKRGSRYLRYALMEATRLVCHWEPTFSSYLAKKLAEGKHYNVAISHAAKKLIRVMYHLQKTNQTFKSA